MKTRIILGTRGSQLARWQTDWVAEQLRAVAPGIEIAIETITTQGDRVLDAPLAQIGDKGLFTREIEIALVERRIDAAVHSLKDVPTDLPDGLTLAAICEREDVRDALVSRLGVGLDALPRGARVGTSSLRRAAQLRAHRPDLTIVNIRGNVDTRLRKATTDEYDAIVLAVAGLKRLGLDTRITEYLSLDVMLPAPGQGALAIETRADDTDTCALIALLDHAPTRAATDAERAFLRALGGGCQVPVAAYGEVIGDTLRLRGLIASEDGTRVARGEVSGDVASAESLGTRLAHELSNRGNERVNGQQ
ncbi:MAG: hydroxymethylbilane synthase [Chloroflexi bacterium]|nr:hydroxymethylbilane synthase [Chloroflexota bacterium]